MSENKSEPKAQDRADKWANAQHFGKMSEAMVADFYKANGFKIKKMNYKSRYGEIDVIAQKNEELVFIEVKARSSVSFLSPCEYVTPAKQKKIVKTALCYLADIGTDDFLIRFDVAEVVKKDNRITLNCITNAFEADGEYN